MEKKGTKKSGNIIKVSFHEPVNNRVDYYFGSLKAIYMQFSKEQIGCGLDTLYASKITYANSKVTNKCIISKHQIVRAGSKAV